MPNCKCGVRKDCICNAFKRITDQTEEDKLIQFLMGSDDHYSHIKVQILLMEPLPSLDKIYSRLIRVEKQEEIQIERNFEIANYSAKSQEVKQDNAKYSKGGTRSGGRFKKVNKDNLFCDHCRQTKHTKDQFFELICYPYLWTWPRVGRQQQQHNYTYQIHVNQVGSTNSIHNKSEVNEDHENINFMLSEVYKMMKGKQVAYHQYSTRKISLLLPVTQVKTQHLYQIMHLLLG